MPELTSLARRRSLRVGVPLALLAVVVVYLLALWPWLLSWGATPAERDGPLPGDERVANATDQSTRAITVHAPAYVTWQWLVQLGQDRGGFYSYDWLENLVGARIRNADRVHGEWQTLRVGDVVRAIPPGYFGDPLDPPGWRVAAIAPGEWFVLENWGLFLVRPIDARTSRLIVRTRYRDPTWWGPLVTRFAFGPSHFVMERQMLRGIARRAEGRQPSPALDAVAAAGFAAASVAVAAAFLRRRRRRPWVLLPALLAAAIVWWTDDVAAAGAGFTALGLTMLGAAQLRRAWPLVLPVPAIVLLVLLLAGDAFLAFGVAFALAAVAWGTWMWLTSRGAPRTAAAPTLLPPTV